MSLGSQIRRRRVAVPLAAAVLALAVGGAVHAALSHAASTTSPACSANTTVQTDKGSVCGVTSDGITTYFSVSYAAAPVGNLRWQPPQPHALWSGVLASTQEAVECTNVFTQFTHANSSEDCLNLKIMVPAGRNPGAKLPVMFEFHGGGFIGEARTDDGSNLVLKQAHGAGLWARIVACGVRGWGAGLSVAGRGVFWRRVDVSGVSLVSAGRVFGVADAEPVGRLCAARVGWV